MNGKVCSYDFSIILNFTLANQGKCDMGKGSKVS